MSRTLNQVIKDMAFESKVDYKPFEDDLEPQDYYERGYQVGATALAEYHDELHPVKMWQVLVFDDHENYNGPRLYTVPATSGRDAQLMAFILDHGIEDDRYRHSSVVERGDMELAQMHTEILSVSRVG